MTDARYPRDEQYEAEITDSDEFDVVGFPPDRPMGVGDLLAADVTAAGEYAPDDLRRRQHRLTTERARPGDPAVIPDAPLADPDDPYGSDPAEQAVGSRGASDWDVLDLGGALSDSAAADHAPIDSWPAEEAALHLIDDEEPPADPLPTLEATRAGLGGRDHRGRAR